MKSEYHEGSEALRAMSIEEFEQTVMGGCPVFTNQQRAAARFLEALGYRFLYEFGFNNCEALAESKGWQP